MAHGKCRHGAMLLLVSILTLWGCATGDSQSSMTAPEGLPIGTRIALPEDAMAIGDITCEFYKAGGDQGLEQFEVRCPGWERPAGQVWRGSLPRPAAQWEERFLNQGALANTVQTEAECGDLEPTRILNDQPAYLRRCASYNGGFPYLLIAAEVNNRAFILWGPAHLAPLFESFIQASLRGTAQEILPGSRSQLIALAEQAVSPEGRLIGLEDMGQFTALDELSTLYNSAKNHQRALELAQRALEIHERIKGANHPSGGYLAARMGRELSRLQPGAAEAMFQRAEPLVKASADASDWPELLVYRAWYALDQGQQEQAEQYAQQSWKLSQAAAARSRQGAMNPRIAHSLIGVGDVYMELGKLTEAEAAYSQALTIFDTVRGGDYHWVGESHQRLAELYRRRQDYAQARDHAQAAVELNRALFGEGRALAEALMTEASVERSAGQPERALALWREIRRMLLDDPTALAQLQAQDVEGYLELLFELAESANSDKSALLDEAFVVSQLGQTPAAGRAVTQVAARLAETDPEVRETARALQDALKARQDIQYELGVEQSKPFLERDTAKEEALKAKLRAAAEEYQGQEQQLQARFPRYGRLVTPTPLNAAEVAKLLRRNEALLRVLPGQRETWVFLVKADGALRGVAVKLPAQQLTAQVERLRAGVDASSGSLPDFDLVLAHNLYQQLFGPLEPALVGVEHLIMAPSGSLLSLPPALLVRRPPESSDYRQAAWLVHDMAFSLLPSVVALEQFRQVAGASQARLPFIGFGDPVFSITAESGALRGGGGVDQVVQDCEFNAKSLAQLAQLPETADELRILARTLGAKREQAVVLGRQATVSAVQAINLENYRIVAFATHALLPGELDCLKEPALALTPQAGNEDHAGSNGLLDAGAIANLKLDAEWVLLSACNTAGGGGGRLRGEGLSGLATAFFYAGSRALLASHWYVVSEPTVFLTTRTFDAYQKSPGMGRAEALRRAQLALLEQPNMAHPLFWAAFTLIGESSPLL